MHVAFITDGNGRWAKARGLTRSEGHTAGLLRTLDVIDICVANGVDVISAFIWSTENWDRPKPEVQHIMRSIVSRGPELARRVNERGIRILHSGDRSALSRSVLRVVDAAVSMTRRNGPNILNLALNYGGKAEILAAINRCLTRNPDRSSLEEADISAHLWHPELPDVDLLVRTGYEQRMSNFMLWQSPHAELYFPDCYWPEIGEQHIKAALRQYERSRRAAEARVS